MLPIGPLYMKSNFLKYLIWFRENKIFYYNVELMGNIVNANLTIWHHLIDWHFYILKFVKRHKLIVKFISFWLCEYILRFNKSFALSSTSSFAFQNIFNTIISYPNFSMTTKTLFLICEHISALNYNFPRILTHPFSTQQTTKLLH